MAASTKQRTSQRLDRMHTITFEEGSGQVHRVIDIRAVKESFRHFRAARRGYVGLALFLAFSGVYIWVLLRQHRASDVGDVNSALSVFLEKQKSDLVAVDSAALYNFIKTKIVPAFLKARWAETSISGTSLSGTTTNDYYHVVGGVVLTAVKGASAECFHGQSCYLSEPITEPFYNMSMPDGLEPFRVPYNDHFKGYSLNIPSATDAKNAASLMSAYEGLFGKDTRELWVNVVLFNPSGAKTITMVAFGASVTVHNDIRFYDKIMTIPYRQYPESPAVKYLQVFFEMMLVVITTYSFLVPMLKHRYCKPPIEWATHAMTHDELSRVEEWVASWQHFPAVGGRPLLATPCALLVLLSISSIIWIHLGFLYLDVVDFGKGGSYDWLFEDPLSAAKTLPAKLTASLNAMDKRTLPMVESVYAITSGYNNYFLLHACVMVILVVQMQQHLMFQKHLSMVSDTFSGITDDLVHMGLVLCIVCFFFGVVNSLAFGVYDAAFATLDSSFFDMFLITFGLYRPASATPFLQSTFKYSPHVLSAEWTMSYLPLFIQVFFKALVVLLLFKLLMGVVMESYKKHKPKEDVPSVRSDLTLLSRNLYQHLLERNFLPSYVDFLHVALAIAFYERSLPADAPEWKRKFIGLDHESEVAAALNAVIMDSAPEAVRKIARKHGMKYCRHREVAYVLGTYGSNRQKTRVKYAKTLVKKERKHRAEAEQADENIAMATFDDDVQKQLDEMRDCWEGDYDSVAFLDQKAKELFNQKLKETFNHYDSLGIGTVDHRLMPYLLYAMGFRISGNHLAKLLYKHDANQDGDASLHELHEFIYDDELIGHWKPDLEQCGRLEIKPSQSRRALYDSTQDDDEIENTEMESAKNANKRPSRSSTGGGIESPLLSGRRGQNRDDCVVA